jgi:BirA family biotin operon repressor/biotin-[acetyl-CoA-carboxylase] ligase
LIETVPEIGSTNTALLARLGAGEAVPEGHWLVADRQRAGRGRAGRVWSDGFGNFMGSTVARLRCADPMPQTLALVAGVAVHKAVAGLAPAGELRLKWPNDLLLDGAKLAGILLERQGDAVVVGIGVNLVQAPEVPGRRTTCLAAAGAPVSRDDFAAALAAEWSAALIRWHLGEWPVLREEWLLRAHPAGTLVSVKDRAQGELTGAFAGIDENGVAFLSLADGQRHAIHAGDIDLVG